MTTGHEELLARLRTVWRFDADLQQVHNDAAAAIRALTAQVVERDAVIEQARAVAEDAGLMNYEEDNYAAGAQHVAAVLSQAPRDALAAHDETVRATALREAAERFDHMPITPKPTNAAVWLRSRADQEEARK